MLSDLHYGEVIQSMEAHARDLGYHLSLVVVEHSGLPAQLSERFDNLDGVIILGGGDITESVVNQAIEEEVPAILVDANVPSALVDSVLIDNFSGAFAATRFLIERGYQRIGCIQGPNKYPSLVERFQGYCAAMIAAGLPLDPAFIQPPISSGFPNKGYREMQALLQRPVVPDAVFCVSDRTALGAFEALAQAGKRVPDDVALVGFDNIPHGEYTRPPLTTINMPKRLMGEVAIRRLHDIIQGRMYEAPVKTILHTSLVIRASA
jgi:LacI family transcriptional regulator